MSTKLPQKLVADFTTTLATGISAGGTSVTLFTATDDDGVVLPTGKYLLTIDKDTSQKEYWSCTVTGTNITAISRISRQGTLTSGSQYAHRIGASVTMTDFAAILFLSNLLKGDDDLDASTPLKYDASPSLSDNDELATVGYVLSVVTGGTVAFSSQTISGIAGETLAVGSIVYFKASDQRFWKADKSGGSTSLNLIIGVSQGIATAGNGVTIQLSGLAAQFSSLTPGTKYYLGTAGAVSATYSDCFLGWAFNATTILMASFFYDAIPGNTSNHYVVYEEDSEASDDYIITITPSIIAYPIGLTINFKAATANTGAATLNVNGIGAIAIKKNVTEDLTTGDILANQIQTVVYDGTNFQLITATNSGGATKSITAGATINGATLPVPVYQNKTDNEFYACDGNDLNALKFLGFAVSNGTDGNPMTVRFTGIVSGFTGLDEGEKYYLSDTVGTIQNSPGTYEVLVGVAISQTELLIQKGKRYASGAFSTVGATYDITLGFRPSFITTSISNSLDDESFGSWSVFGGNSSLQLTDIDGNYDATASNSSLHDSNGAVTVTNVTDTGFRFTRASTDGTTYYYNWTAEGEL